MLFAFSIFGISQACAQNIPNFEIEELDEGEWIEEPPYIGQVFTLKVSGKCDGCGDEYSEEDEAIDCSIPGVSDWEQVMEDLIKQVAENFCQECQNCSKTGNSDCWGHHHCHDCGDCIDEPFCQACYELSDEYFLCSNCGENNYVDHCDYCNKHLGADVERCDCGVAIPHCVDCADQKCEYCDVCLIIDGNETSFAVGACMEHEICASCLEEGFDENHCKDCYSCASEVCGECGLCEDCTLNNNHCPLCYQCFGYGQSIPYCESGGDHCVDCCDDNDWICVQCGQCVEAYGLEYCEDCGLCEECCVNNSEEEGCTHGYCLFSTEYDDHVCPYCQKCPDDTECEYCGYCEECQEDYHCEHELCPEGPDWEDHLCLDCGQCFDPDELCEYCGKCGDCADGYHCEHGYCPDGDLDDGDHFVCDQCGECFEGFDRCDYCELCTTCCEANTEIEGCEHDLCVESPDFVDHWCYEDDQCLEKCNHNSGCAHTNKSSQWSSDGTAHWHVCNDCGTAVDKAVHIEGAPVTITEPDTDMRKNGTASVSCNICNYSMSVISIPFTPIPEDGSPYIITQPKNYEGKTSTVDWWYGPSEYVNRYVTFTVRAGGQNLTYQWYEQLGNAAAKAITDDGFYHQGGKTASLKVYVFTDACINPDYQKYYCVVTNAAGSAQTRTAGIRAEHSFGHYADNGDGTHSYVCNGECYVAKSTKPHRLSEWELIRPATDTQTGLLRQECMDCGAKSEKVIPKVEPGHVHAYDQPRYKSDEHWFACRCGIVSTAPHAPHTWGTPVVTEAPTEKKTGSQDVSCTACGYTKTEKLDRLPHTHDYYSFYSDIYNNPKKGGYSNVQHYSYCKSGDGQMIAERHKYEPWSVERYPNDSLTGIISRNCIFCPYVEKKHYEASTYPIMVESGKANYSAAAPGTLITVTFETYQGTKWKNGVTCWKDMSSEGIGLEPIAMSNAYSSTMTFTMPQGPVGIAVHNTVTCDHTGGTVMGKRLEPTCKGYGHEPDVLCKDCGKVVTEGTRIAALGHLLSTTPVSGTEQPLYCTYHIFNKLTNTSSETYPTGHGYAGDFICSRCNQTVKGKRTPIVHKMHYTWIDNYGEHSTVYPSGVEYPDPVTQPTCTTFGLGSDKHCAACHKLLTRGKKIPRLGHEWGEWTTVREATTTSRGREQHVCLRDENHVQTRVIDYSGPDYRLKADKTKIYFEWEYGETPEPQTVTFTSIGRNRVTGLGSIVGTLGPQRVDVALSGMHMTITPKVEEVLENQSQKVVRLSSVTYRFAAINYDEFTAPAITVTFKIKKAQPALSFGISYRTIRLGDDFTAPELAGVDDDMAGALTWQSSNNAVATIDPATGALNIKSNGRTTITAKYAGDEFHASAQASYTLEVRNPNVTGDVNKDGAISIADVTSLVNIIQGKDNAEPHQYNHLVADTNLDGKTSNADVTSLVNTILGKNALMYVDDVFTIGGCTVATGTVLSGKFNTGQPILLRSTNDALGDIPTPVVRIEMFRRVVPEAVPGDGVGIVINVDKANVNRGDVLATASSNIVRSKTIRGSMYLLTKAEGGRHTPIQMGYKPTMLVGGKTFNVKINNLGTVDGAAATMIMPGQTAEGIVLEVEDEGVTPLSYVGQQVVLRESGRTIGKLTITGQ